jgi:hypothetical protein
MIVLIDPFSYLSWVSIGNQFNLHSEHFQSWPFMKRHHFISEKAALNFSFHWIHRLSIAAQTIMLLMNSKARCIRSYEWKFTPSSSIPYCLLEHLIHQRIDSDVSVLNRFILDQPRSLCVKPIYPMIHPVLTMRDPFILGSTLVPRWETGSSCGSLDESRVYPVYRLSRHHKTRFGADRTWWNSRTSSETEDNELTERALNDASQIGIWDYGRRSRIGKNRRQLQKNLVYSVSFSQNMAGIYHVVGRFSVTSHFDQNIKASDWPSLRGPFSFTHALNELRNSIRIRSILNRLFPIKFPGWIVGCQNTGVSPVKFPSPKI